MEEVASHLIEIKKRVVSFLLLYLVMFAICYCYSQEIYFFLISPLINTLDSQMHRVIYTDLTEVFTTYIKISAFSAFILSFPFLSWHIYRFVSPGLFKIEKRITAFILFMSPLLFWLGAAGMFYLVVPKAWQFFINFEIYDAKMPLVLEAKISEYVGLMMNLVLAFGIAAELPIVIVILRLLNILSTKGIIKQRRVAIVLIFVFAGVVTPPDVMSQIALALPMVLLYEVSILSCKIIDKRKINA